MKRPRPGYQDEFADRFSFCRDKSAIDDFRFGGQPDLKNNVVLILMGVFVFNACLTGTVILLTGAGRLTLPKEVLYLLSCATILGATYMLMRLVDVLFRPLGAVGGRVDWFEPFERMYKIAMGLPPYPNMQPV